MHFHFPDLEPLIAQVQSRLVRAENGPHLRTVRIGSCSGAAAVAKVHFYCRETYSGALSTYPK